ncbi:Uma2 family endonuclease [Nannocystis pusilla]|uniref:Uma2 family endonuclease n=1 Tax=Nannocystis pusilla TaxID=889268 RepID=UPI003B7C082B
MVAPDVYVIDGVALHLTEVKNWKTWEHDGKAPTLALEIASDEYPKDYDDTLIEHYQDLGVRELVRYDPLQRGRPRARAVRPLRPRRAWTPAPSPRPR